MYIDDISSQVQVFLYSVGFGFLLGLLYDLFKTVNKFVFRTDNAVFIQDVLYFVLVSFLSFVFLLVVNDGKFRLHIFAAFLLGFGVYYLTMGRFFFGLVVLTYRKLKRIFNTTSMIILSPFFPVFSIFKKLWKSKAKNSEKNEKKSKINQKPS